MNTVKDIASPLLVCPDSLAKQVRKLLRQRSVFQALRGLSVLLLSAFDRGFVATVSIVSIYGIRPWCKVTVRGLENVQREGKILYLMRHRSSFAPLFIECRVIFPWLLWTMCMWPVNVGKEKHLGRLPRFLQRYLHHVGIIFLLEKNGATWSHRSKVVEQEIAAFDQVDCMMFLFPTGTRDKPNEEAVRPFMRGVGRVVAEARPNIAFIWDDDSFDFWPKGRWLPKIKWRYLKCAGWCIPIGWHRSRFTITISRPLSTSDPASGVDQLCQDHTGNETAQVVADYLRDLCQLWAEQRCDLEGSGKTDNPILARDVQQL